MSKKVFTTSNGNPVDDDQNSMTAGNRGPVLLQDFHLIDKLAHFNRERIPERVVHAKGSGAHGYFEVTKDVRHLCKAKFLNEVGKRTPVFTRFSTVGGEKGSADSVRDPRGFSIKMYTEEGNWDMVGNNTPVFFIRDAIKFPDLIHTQKRNPQTNLKDADMFWDFFANSPESTHQVTILFSNRGTPDGYRHMNGYYGHTLKLVNEEGKGHYVKIHFKADQGIKNLKANQAVKIAGENPDYAGQDLLEAINRKEFPTWTAHLQVMKLEDAEHYQFDPFDITKVWPHSDFPLQEFGKLVLDRNPENYHADTEQVAFSPSNMVPGIEPSPDKMLQGRLFAYADAHRYRLSANFKQIPINCPYLAQVNNTQRDGLMTVNGNSGSAPNYGPTSFDGPEPLHPTPKTNSTNPIITSNSVNSGPVQDDMVTDTKAQTNGYKDARIYPSTIPARYQQPIIDNDFVQPGNLYRKLSEQEQTDLINNIVGHLGNAQKFIQHKMVEHFKRADADYGRRVEEGLAKA